MKDAIASITTQVRQRLVALEDEREKLKAVLHLLVDGEAPAAQPKRRGRPARNAVENSAAQEYGTRPESTSS